MFPEYLKYEHPRTNQFGIVCYIKLTDTIDGKNVIEIRKIYEEDSSTKWTIPFHYISK
ncbi:hypothetical protein MNBD_BACTEROID03-1578 [hydrothermal vent metagenome]|uniref:Uncharacterized protein n=1 Tax=hydrothermal vent metagenome TaxID=652676 RepID=A0A3B0TNU7_9ZZZZ